MTKDDLLRRMAEANMMSRKDVTEDDFTEFDYEQQTESIQSMVDAVEEFIQTNPEWADEFIPILDEFKRSLTT